jgi:hypothetical protein
MTTARHFRRLRQRPALYWARRLETRAGRRSENRGCNGPLRAYATISAPPTWLRRNVGKSAQRLAEGPCASGLYLARFFQ